MSSIKSLADEYLRFGSGSKQRRTMASTAGVTDGLNAVIRSSGWRRSANICGTHSRNGPERTGNAGWPVNNSNKIRPSE